MSTTIDPAAEPAHGRTAERAHRPDERQRALDDPALAAATRRLVDGLAPLLGLAPGEIRVHTGLRRGTALPSGASGLAEGDEVYLAERFDPATREGRSLLVHELAHVAQQRGRSPDSGLVDPEAEARALARAAVTGAPLWRPRARLPYGTAAADNGPATLPRPATPAPRPAAPAPAADPAAEETPGEIGVLRGRLAAVVKRRHWGLLIRIDKILSGRSVSSENARTCLQLLDPLPFVVARELVLALNGKRRVDLGRALEDGHHRSFPVATVAVLAAMPPILLSQLDSSNVEGLETTSLGPGELRAAIEVLRGLRPAVLKELVTGKQGPQFTQLLTGPAPFGTDEAAIGKALADETAAEKVEHETAAAAELKKAIKELGALLASPSRPDAVRALERMANLGPGAPPAPARSDTGATGPDAGTPAAVAPTRPEPPDPGPQLRRVVRVLEFTGAIERLLAALGDSERWAGGPHAAKLLLMLAAREPQRNLARAEELLSYGILDWKIFDAEARYAYVLVRAVPLDLQDRWKRLDGGKWFARLEDNIPSDDVLAGHYRGVGSRADAFDPDATGLKSNADLADATAVVKAIDSEVKDKGVNGFSAVTLLRKILAVGRTKGQTTPAAAGPNRRKIEMVIDRLDTLGHLDTILDALPDAHLLNEMWRGELLELMAARDPRHLERHARRLLSYDWDDWAVTARDAWLAFHLVRSLAPADRARLEAEDPDRFASIQSEMTDRMRASAAVTNLGGKETFETRDRLRDRLRDDRVWRPGADQKRVAARVAQLRSLIIQLYALDDRRWVFLRSREVRADRVRGLENLVADLGLYDEQNRPHFEPDQLRSTASGEEGVFQLIAEYARLIAVGAEVLWLARTSLFTDTIRVDDLDLGDLAWALGGDISGARVADREQVTEVDARTGRRNRAPANALGFAVNDRAGTVTLTLPRLELTGFNRSFTGMSLRTGRISVTGLAIEASFSDRGYDRPVGARAAFRRADVADTVVAGDGLPGGTLAASHLGISPLQFASGATGVENLKEKGKDGWIPIPVLDPFLRVLSHVVSFMGTVPGLTSSIPLVLGPGDILSGPVTGGAPWLAQKFASFTTDQVATPILEGALGLVTDGVFRTPRTVAERAKDAAAMLRYFSVSIGSLEVEGISLGGVQEVESVKVSNLLIGLGRSRPTVLRTERDSIRKRRQIAAAAPGAFTPDELVKLGTREAQIEAELKRLEPLEAELDRLEARHRWNEESLGTAERSRLVELSNLLRQTAGGSVDVASIAVTGLSGLVNAAGIDVGPVHAEAAGPSRSGEYLPPEELIERFQKEREPVTLREFAGGVTAAGTIKTVGFRRQPGQPTLRIQLGVPTVAEVRQQIAALGTDARFALLREKLREWVEPPAPDMQNLLERLAYLESLQAEPVDLTGKSVQRFRSRWEERELQELRTRAREFFSLTVQALRLEGIAAVYDPARLGLGVRAAEFEATGIEVGSTRIGAITGQQLGVGVALDAGGGRLPDDAERKLADAGLPGARPALTFGAGSLTVKGVESPGVDVKRVTVNGLAGRVVTDGTTLRVPDLVATSAELEGITYESAGSRLFALGTTRTGRITASVRVETAALPRGGKGPDSAQVDGYRPTRLVVEDLRITRVDADRLGMDVTAPKPGYSVEATSGALIGVWVSDLVVPLDGNEVKITGSLGVDQVEQLRFLVVSRALTGGPTTIRGTLGSPVAAGPRAGALQVQLLQSGGKSVDVSGVTLTEGELATDDGTIRIRKAGLEGHIDQDPDGLIRFSEIGPLRVEVSSIDWRAGDGRLTANGATVLEGVEAAGTWKSEPDTEVGGQVVPGSAVLHLTLLKIARITSDDLHYRDGIVDLHLGRDRTRQPDLLEIRDVVARDLRWERGKGIVGGRLRTGAAKVALGGRVSGTVTPATRMGAAATVTDALFVRAALEASSIGLTFHEKGRIVARVRGGKAELGLGDTEEANKHQARFEDLDTGVVDIHGNTIDVGPEGSAGLKLGSLTLDALDWKGESFGLQLKQGDGTVVMGGITARLRIELHPPGHKGGRFKRLVVRQLEVAETRATGVALILSDAVIRLPAAPASVLGTIKLEAPPGGEGFEIAADRSGKGLNFTGRLTITGTEGVDGLNLPRIAADAGSWLATADLKAKSLTADFFGVGGMTLSLAKPSLTSIKAFLPGDSTLKGGSFIHVLEALPPKVKPEGKELPEFGIRAEALRFEQAPSTTGGDLESKLTVSGTEVTGLEYRNSDYGLHLFVAKATAPGDITHNLTTGEGKIPNLVIEDGFVQIDLVTLLAKFPSSPKPPAADKATEIVNAWNELAAALRPYADVIDSLNGTLELTITAGSTSIPVNLFFDKGKINFDVLAAITLDKVHWASLGFGMDGDDLVLRAFGTVELLRWNLPHGEAKLAEKGRVVYLKRLLEPTPASQQSLAQRLADDSSPPGALSISDISADLSIENPREIALSFGAGTRVVLAPFSITKLRAAGALGGRSAAGIARPGEIVPISLERAKVKETELAFTDTKVATGAIEISNLKDARITFAGLTPTMFSGAVRKATAQNITWKRVGGKKK